MARSNRTEFAILGMLAREPLSGYDIKKLVGERLAHFWHESLGHIYPVLKRLRERGWVVRTVQGGQGPPPRHEYAITSEGRAALRAWFREPIEPPPPRNELLLRVFLGRFTETEVLRARIREYRAVRRGQLERFETIRDLVEREGRNDPDLRYWRLTLRAGIHAARAALAWCDEALTELQEAP
jgi:DNA-binding PadR family transcriptional regulator